MTQLEVKTTLIYHNLVKVEYLRDYGIKHNLTITAIDGACDDNNNIIRNYVAVLNDAI